MRPHKSGDSGAYWPGHPVSGPPPTCGFRTAVDLASGSRPAVSAVTLSMSVDCRQILLTNPAAVQSLACTQATHLRACATLWPLWLCKCHQVADCPVLIMMHLQGGNEAR